MEKVGTAASERRVVEALRLLFLAHGGWKLAKMPLDKLVWASDLKVVEATHPFSLCCCGGGKGEDGILAFGPFRSNVSRESLLALVLTHHLHFSLH